MQLIDDSAHKLGYMIYESSILMKGVNSGIYVKIDSLGGISHLDCEKFSRELSARIDDEDLLPNYFIEVSSPGLKRKLKSIEDFRRFTGSPVKVVYIEDDRNITLKGEIKNVSGDVIVLQSEDKEYSVPMGTIKHANLDY